MDMLLRGKRVISRSRSIIRSDGMIKFINRAVKHAYFMKFPEKKKKYCRDILFVNGCALEAPTWYRVDHQMEQLVSNGLTTDTVFYTDLTIEHMKYYRGFVFFRCPITDTVRDFIKEAKSNNKACFFDIDDLVIDTKYTNQNEYVAAMPTHEKALYDDGVNRMQETLKLCDYAITTTKTLQRELQNYCSEVYVNRNVASDEIQHYSALALKNTKKNSQRIVIGYFSGSITHNADFEMILPSLIKVLESHKNVYLKVTGILDIPQELERYKDRIINDKFYNQRDFPTVIASCDIALAPLTKSIFNDAKSENKWLLPALVKVPTIASNAGAFKEVITPDITGVLVDGGDWYDAIDRMVRQPEFRSAIADAAYKQVSTKHITVYSGKGVSDFIKSKLARNVAFVLPSTDISGGVTVVLKHAAILQRHGWDVTIIDAINARALAKSKKEYSYRDTIPGHNVITAIRVNNEAFYDTMVATLWSTLKFVKEYPNVRHRLYFVQGFETDFNGPGMGELRFLSNATYSDETGLRYITMSPWCERWLDDSFGKHALRCSNGIDLDAYPYHKRSFEKGKKIKILIEGDSKTATKNTDEAFQIVQKLNNDDYHVSYLSYRKEPKPWYKVDTFYNRIAPDEVGKVYAACDILIKTSLLESFSYPPLEMMATGGFVVALPNDGNLEYLKDKQNCLMYTPGDIDEAVSLVEMIKKDPKLRDRLSKQGRATAEKYSWDNIEKDIVRLYE